ASEVTGSGRLRIDEEKDCEKTTALNIDGGDLQVAKSWVAGRFLTRLWVTIHKIPDGWVWGKRRQRLRWPAGAATASEVAAAAAKAGS
ncbi:hypothetical protein NP118_23570, partial [Salmonella enterica]|nr:hypothetical protein [Salmonella enterica]